MSFTFKGVDLDQILGSESSWGGIGEGVEYYKGLGSYSTSGEINDRNHANLNYKIDGVDISNKAMVNRITSTSDQVGNSTIVWRPNDATHVRIYGRGGGGGGAGGGGGVQNSWTYTATEGGGKGGDGGDGGWYFSNAIPSENLSYIRYNVGAGGNGGAEGDNRSHPNENKTTAKAGSGGSNGSPTNFMMVYNTHTVSTDIAGGKGGKAANAAWVYDNHYKFYPDVEQGAAGDDGVLRIVKSTANSPNDYDQYNKTNTVGGTFSWSNGLSNWSNGPIVDRVVNMWNYKDFAAGGTGGERGWVSRHASHYNNQSPGNKGRDGGIIIMWLYDLH